MTDITSAVSTDNVPTPYIAAPPGVMLHGGERQYQPQPGLITPADFKRALNPLQHVPMLGTFYRAETSTSVPAPLQILGSVAVGAATGGPAGVFGAVMFNFAQMLISLGPAVPGHELQAADTPSRSDGPTDVGSKPAGQTGVMYADGSTGTPTWRPGELTNFDVTLIQQAAATKTSASADTGSDVPPARDLARIAYERAISASGGLSELYQ